MELPGRSLRSKLIGAFLLPTLIIVLLYGVLTYFSARAELEEELGRRLVSIGQTMSADMSRGLEAEQLTRLDESKTRTLNRFRQRLLATREDTGVRRVFLFDPNLASLVDTDEQVAFGQKLFELEADRFEITQALERGEARTSVLFSDKDGTRYKTAYVPIFSYNKESRERGPVVAALGIEASAEYFALLTNFASGLIGLGALSLALVILAGILLARGLSQAVNELVGAAKALERGELERPVVREDEIERRRQGDELDSLALSFELMRRAVLGRDQQMQMMLSGIAHEVRNPLGGMELFCGLLREDLEFEDEPDQDKIDKVKRIERELVYLNKVVTDFLDFARHRPLERDRFDAQGILAELQMLLAPQAEATGCEVAVEVEPEGLEFTADRERFRRAIINSVRNSWQASPDGGTITIRAFASDEDPDVRVLEVQDQGAGIPEEKLAEILTPFYTTKEKGSGLGLALTKKIIEQHGGQMSLTSQVGQGTCVRFEIPFDESLEPVMSEAAIPEGWLG